MVATPASQSSTAYRAAHPAACGLRCRRTPHRLLTAGPPCIPGRTHRGKPEGWAVAQADQDPAPCRRRRCRQEGAGAGGHPGPTTPPRPGGGGAETTALARPGGPAPRRAPISAVRRDPQKIGPTGQDNGPAGPGPGPCGTAVFPIRPSVYGACATRIFLDAVVVLRCHAGNGGDPHGRPAAGRSAYGCGRSLAAGAGGRLPVAADAGPRAVRLARRIPGRG